MKIIIILMTLGIYVFGSAINLPKNFIANFTQTITTAKKKKIHYNGKIYFSNQKLLKWHYNKPKKKEVCTNGRKLTVIDYDLEQASFFKISKGFDFAKIVKKAKLHKKNIYVARYEKVDYTIQLDNAKKLHSIAYFDSLENKVQILFKQVKYGKTNLSKKTMTCKVPKNFDIING